MSRLSAGLANDSTTLDERVVTLPTGTQKLDPAKHANRLLQISTADAAYTITLPLAKGSGDIYEFLSTVIRTSGSIIITASHGAVSNKIVGTVKNVTSAATVVTFSSTTNDTMTINNTTKGGAAAGDYIKLQDVAEGVWRVVDANLFSSGAEATPFSG
jgi:hypothetical protein